MYSSYSTALQSSLLAFAPDAVLVFSNQRLAEIERLRESCRVVDVDMAEFLGDGEPQSDTLRRLLENRGRLSLWLAFGVEGVDLAALLAACRRRRVRTCAVHRFMQPACGFCREYTERTGVLVRNAEFDLLVSSFEQAFGIPGGVASGSILYIGNMRTSAVGYCYSASQPPVLCDCIRMLMRQVIDRDARLVTEDRVLIKQVQAQ